MKKQQQFTVEQYQAAKVVAKELGINSVGKTKQTLVDLVNAKLKEQNTSAPKVVKEKWSTNGFGFNAGDIVNITSKTIEKNGVTKEILQGREAKVLGPSIVAGFIKALLIDTKTGQILACPITLDINKIEKIETQIILVA